MIRPPPPWTPQAERIANEARAALAELRELLEPDTARAVDAYGDLAREVRARRVLYDFAQHPGGLALVGEALRQREAPIVLPPREELPLLDDGTSACMRERARPTGDEPPGYREVDAQDFIDAAVFAMRAAAAAAGQRIAPDAWLRSERVVFGADRSVGGDRTVLVSTDGRFVGSHVIHVAADGRTFNPWE